MKKIVAYLLVLLVGISFVLFRVSIGDAEVLFKGSSLLFQSILLGGIGGIIYCLRAVYLHKCLKKDWDSVWYVWYYVRPVLSLVLGGVSWVFLKAGILVLGADSNAPNNIYGYLAIAFVAGYNVDNFLGKIEEFFESSMGIKKSRSSNVGESKDKGESNG
jgi:hypothetical protein